MARASTFAWDLAMGLIEGGRRSCRHVLEGLDLTEEMELTCAGNLAIAIADVSSRVPNERERGRRHGDEERRRAREIGPHDRTYEVQSAATLAQEATVSVSPRSPVRPSATRTMSMRARRSGGPSARYHEARCACPRSSRAAARSPHHDPSMRTCTSGIHSGTRKEQAHALVPEGNPGGMSWITVGGEKRSIVVRSQWGRSV